MLYRYTRKDKRVETKQNIMFRNNSNLDPFKSTADLKFFESSYSDSKLRNELVVINNAK